MDHKALQEQLFAYYDGELDPAARQNVEAHLALCQECRERSKRWAATAKVFFQAPKPVTSEFFVRQVMNKIKTVAKPKRALSWNIPWRLLVPAAGLAIIFLIGLRPVEYPALMDTMIMGESIESGSSNIFSARPPTLDDTLTMVMEGSS